ncbi:site-specific integrase [Acholeplasma sp. OttesenSCG-928-E16]|nr:site-specific integrase [Acholeplasma sp. OttesenSCG-928-E16]
MELKKQINDFLDWNFVNNGKGTARNYKKLIEALMPFFENLNIESLRDLEEIHCTELYRYLQANFNQKNNTMNKHRGIIINMLNFHKIKSTFLLSSKLKNDKLATQPLDNDELDLVISYIMSLPISRNDNNIMYKCLILLMYNSGSRITALLNVEQDHIYFSRNLKGLSSIFLPKAKGNKGMFIYFSPKLNDLIKTLLGINPQKKFLFWNLRLNRQLNYNDDVRNFLNRVKKKLDIRKLHPHQFRKTMAINMKLNGCDYDTLQVLLGHEDITTTKIYANPNHVLAKARFAKFNTLDNKTYKKLEKIENLLN